nr:MAG TPA: hypothetical protein [Caudoviricetes sp.]
MSVPGHWYRRFLLMSQLYIILHSAGRVNHFSLKI